MSRLRRPTTPVFVVNQEPASVYVLGPLPLPVGAATEATLAALNAKVTAVDTGAVVVASSALPTGAATSALQTTGNTSLSSIDGKVLTDAQLRATPVPVSGPLTDAQLRASAVPVEAAALPLPTGASTSALQTTGNTSLSSIDTKTPALGQALAAASVPVVLTAAQIVTLTPPTSVGITGTATVAGNKTNNNAAPSTDNLGVLPAVANAAAPTRTEGNLGTLRTTLSGDLAVTLDSEAVVLGAGAAVIGALTANQTVDVARANGQPVQIGQGNAGTGTLRVAIAADQTAFNVKINDGADTLQITAAGEAQVAGIKSNDAGVPGSTNVGVLPSVANAAAPTRTEAAQGSLSTTLTGDLRVTLDGETVPSTQSGTWTVQPGNTVNTTPWLMSSKTDLAPAAPTTATVGVASGSAVAANASRKGLHLRNTSTTGQRISLSMNGAAVLDSGVTLYPQDAWEMAEYDFDVGAINAISSAASGRLSVQEFS